MKNKIILFVIIAIFLFVNAVNAQKKQNEWQSLFNGKNLKGWEVKSKPVDKEKEFWSVVDGCIVANSMGDSIHDYVWLQSKKEYTNFELKFRFKVCKGIKGNSGIQIMSRYDDKEFWLDGPQIDINPNDPFRCGMMYDETRDVKHWIFPFIEIDKGWVKPGMELNKVIFRYCDNTDPWNYFFVRVRDLYITCFLNGKLVTDYDGLGFLDDAIHQKYNVGTTGHIAFQIHKNDQVQISFSEIFIREF